MSAEAVRTAVGEDGIEIAVGALKQIASGKDEDGIDVAVAERMDAAKTLLRYGLAYVDDYGNAGVGP